jgi:simple sugar transport system substrate-binding protein/ribose transport system substrate-binding protein
MIRYASGHRSVPVVVVSVVALLATACLAAGPAAVGASSSKFTLNPTIASRIHSGKTPVVRLSFIDPCLYTGQILAGGMKKAARDFHLDAQMIGPCSGSITEQISQLASINRLVNVDCLGVLVGASNNQYINVINQAVDKGIPVFTYNSGDIPQSRRLAFFGENIVAGAKLAANTVIAWARQHHKTLRKIGIISFDPPSSWATPREDTFKRLVSRAFPQAQWFGPYKEGFTATENVAAVQGMLDAHPDLDFVYSTDQTEYTAKVMSTRHLNGKMFTAGHNFDPGTIQAILNHQAVTTIAQNYPLQAYATVRACANLLLHGQLPQKKVNYIPHFAITWKDAYKYRGQSG